MTVAEEFFEPWESAPIDSLPGFLELVGDTFAKWSDRGVEFAWRGAVDASWPLHSSLYRRMVWTNPSHTKEEHLSEQERRVLADANRWGLHFSGFARLPVLYELAMLQHFASPTRLIDVTFDPLVALFFAVEQRFDAQGNERHGDDDGRLFVFDVSNRLLNEGSAEERSLDGHYSRPWKTKDGQPSNWTTAVRAWRPAPVEARFAAQNGGFLLGGVPQVTTGGRAWKAGPGAGAGTVPVARVRESTSVAVHFARLDAGVGRPADNPSFTFRVSADAKPGIRDALRRWFDIEARTIYPDHPGFASFGTPGLKSAP